MCLAIPARVVALTGGDNAKVDLGGVRREISLALVEDVAVGDYVIVHVGYALSRLDADEASKPDVLLEAAGLRSKQAEKRYQDLAHAKQVNAAQADTLNKTAGAHRGADMRNAGSAPRPSEAPPNAPAAKRGEPA